MSVDAICSAAPLTSRIFPSIAPRQRINARLANVLPTPCSIVMSNVFPSIPNANPVSIATISNDRKGLTFFAVRKICKAIASMIISSVNRNSLK